MRIAVRPPEYLPRLAYMALMKWVDVFVVADTFQYSRQSFQNRARIRTPDGWSWISVPLVGRQHGTPIDQIDIDTRRAWTSKHRRAFQYNYASTPYFPFIEHELDTLYATRWPTLADLTVSTVEWSHQLFALKSEVIRASSLEGSPASLPAILEILKPDELWSPEGAYEKDRLHVDRIQPFTYREPEYRQHFEGFEPEMTALDIFCNYGQESSRMLGRGVVG